MVQPALCFLAKLKEAPFPAPQKYIVLILDKVKTATLTGWLPCELSKSVQAYSFWEPIAFFPLKGITRILEVWEYSKFLSVP